MRDWERYVRTSLRLSELERGRESRIVRELASQFEDFYREAVARGMTESEADAWAGAQITDWSQFAATLREVDRSHVTSPRDRWSEQLDDRARETEGGWPMFADVWQDVRDASRRLVFQPTFTIVAVLTLAIGIGANTAIFNVIDAILLKPLPYPGSHELVALDHAAPGFEMPRAGAAPFLYFTYREDGRVFRDVGLWRTRTVSATSLPQPEEIQALFVTDGVLPLVGVQPMLGRVFAKEDDAPGATATVVLAFGYWQSRFGADRAVLGRTLMIDGRQREIIGVLPDTFRFLDRDVSVVVPFQFDRSKVVLGELGFSALARLRPDATIADAEADVARLIPIALRRFPPFPGGTVKMFEQARLTPHIRSLKDDLIGEVQATLWVLMGTVGVVLLIACANVANLSLVRAEARQHEFTIRAALGASSKRLVREMLTESLVLALLGGAVGLALAVGSVRLLQALAPGNLPRLQDVTVDLSVLVFALAVSLLAGLLFGVVTALKTARAQLGTALRTGTRTASAGRERHRVRSALVIAQMALALVLLVSAGLMFRTFQALTQVHPGFAQSEDIQTFRLTIPASQVEADEVVARIYHAIVEKVGAVPGVTSVALTSTVPMSGEGVRRDAIYPENHVSAASELPPLRWWKFVSPDFMKTMGGSLVAGRDFTWVDMLERRPVAMVSENLARELWGRPQDAVGKRVRPYASGGWREIVGVVGDIRENGVNRSAPTAVYWPFLVADFFPNANMAAALRSFSLAVRSDRAGSRGLANDLERAVWSINRSLPLANMRTMRELYDRSLAGTSFTLVMLAIAGAMALLLGVAGIYAVMSFIVSQRRRDIGIRLALGGQPSTVMRLFIAQGMTLAGIGAGIGLILAFGVTRLMSSLLFEVGPVDLTTYLIVSLTLMTAAVIACYVPARRAAALDPVDTLRAAS
jgi:predicted permease